MRYLVGFGGSFGNGEAAGAGSLRAALRLGGDQAALAGGGPVARVEWWVGLKCWRMPPGAVPGEEGIAGAVGPVEAVKAGSVSEVWRVMGKGKRGRARRRAAAM